MGSVAFVRRSLLLLAGTLCLASCGDDSGTTPSTVSEPASAMSTTSASTTTQSDQTTTSTAAKADPYASVEAVLVGGDCQKYVTERFVSSAYGDQQACVAAVASGGTADSLKTGKISVSSHHATITVVPHGGPSSGEKVTVKLVLDGDTWKIDSLNSNVPVGP
jgi:hypothetical protein